MSIIPEEIVQQLMLHGSMNKLGVMRIDTEEVEILVVGITGISMENAAILSAHLLLDGVVNGRLQEAHQEQKPEELKLN